MSNQITKSSYCSCWHRKTRFSFVNLKLHNCTVPSEHISIGRNINNFSGVFFSVKLLTNEKQLIEDKSGLDCIMNTVQTWSLRYSVHNNLICLTVYNTGSLIHFKQKIIKNYYLLISDLSSSLALQKLHFECSFR
jgi:hypothetical protein